jgi:hypothetical protein
MLWLQDCANVLLLEDLPRTVASSSHLARPLPPKPWHIAQIMPSFDHPDFMVNTLSMDDEFASLTPSCSHSLGFHPPSTLSPGGMTPATCDGRVANFGSLSLIFTIPQWPSISRFQVGRTPADSMSISARSKWQLGQTYQLQEE